MGFKFAETMSGTYALDSAPEDHRRFEFTIEARAESTLRHLRDGRTDIEGTLDADGLADGVSIAGTLTISPLGRRSIEYEFQFTGDDGKAYRYRGQKDLRLRDLRKSFTELSGRIFDEAGAPIASSLTRFDLRGDLFSFLASFRPA